MSIAIKNVDKARLRQIIANNIRHCRGTATRRELADLADVSDGLITSLEQGRTLPSITTLIKLAEIFGVNLDDLLDLDLPLRHTDVLQSSTEPHPMPTAQEIPTSMFEGLLTISDLAQRYGVSKQRARQLMDTYGLKFYRAGKQIFVPEDEVQKIPHHRPPGRRARDD